MSKLNLSRIFSRCGHLAMLIAVLGGPAACTEQPDPHFRDGVDVQELTFTVTDPNMGIHPNATVLDDEGNPFRFGPIGDETKWVLGDEANNAAGFYSWATMLARQATGEHQYYTATKLQALYEDRDVDNASLETVRDMGVRAYQSVLDNFPTSVSYDPSGVYSFRLAPLAYQGILDLGGIVQGGWVQIQTPTGGTTVVQTDDI